jgi:thiol:disulfide interchange protein DsbA
MENLMMNLRIGAFALALLLVPFAAGAETFQAGRDYQALTFPVAPETGKKVEVREFFWYGCPHCYALEPELKAWLKHLPANAEFIRTPGVAPRWLTHAQIFYALQAMGLEEKYHTVIFDAVQRGEPIDDEDAAAAFLSHHGVDAQKFQDAFNSFGVHMKLEQAQHLNEAFGIDSVPTFVIDGKYKTGPEMAGSSARLFQIVDYLIGKAARERRHHAK